MSKRVNKRVEDGFIKTGNDGVFQDLGDRGSNTDRLGDLQSAS